MITQDNRPLTVLEAAMLGLWLMGYRWVSVDHETAPAWAYTNEPEWNETNAEFYDNYKTQMHLCDDVCGSIISDDIGAGKCELLPWLTARGITPPEVAP